MRGFAPFNLVPAIAVAIPGAIGGGHLEIDGALVLVSVLGLALVVELRSAR
jgi:hypothetical protein